MVFISSNGTYIGPFADEIEGIEWAEPRGIPSHRGHFFSLVLPSEWDERNPERVPVMEEGDVRVATS